MEQGERRTLTHSFLVAFDRNQNGKLSGVQLTKLTEDGKRALDSQGQKLSQIQVGATTAPLQDYVKPYPLDKRTQTSITKTPKSEAQKRTQPTKTPSSSAEDSNNLNTIAKYIEDKIREIKAYEGTSLGREAKEELRAYLKTFQKDARMLREFKNHSPELVKDIKRLYPKQQHTHEKVHQKIYGMDM